MINNIFNKSITKSIEGFHLPRYEEIPNVGLYLDQTAKYINEYLTLFPDLEMTPSMISNYVKKGMIPRSVKKLYNRDQIAYLIFIAVTKTVLSMDNIRMLFQMQQQSYSSEVAYEYFRQELDHIMNQVFHMENSISGEDAGLSQVKLMLKNTIIAVAHKLYLDKAFTMVTLQDSSSKETSE